MKIAKIWYEETRDKKAFSVTGYIHKAANGTATWYQFHDGSRLIIYKRNTIAWGPGWPEETKNCLYAERRLF